MILDVFKKYYATFEQDKNLKFMLDEYNEALVHKGQQVHILNGAKESQGLCQGMDETGALLVTKEGETQVTKIISGEISVRGVYGYV